MATGPRKRVAAARTATIPFMKLLEVVICKTEAKDMTSRLRPILLQAPRYLLSATVLYTAECNTFLAALLFVEEWALALELERNFGACLAVILDSRIGKSLLYVSLMFASKSCLTYSSLSNWVAFGEDTKAMPSGHVQYQSAEVAGER